MEPKYVALPKRIATLFEYVALAAILLLSSIWCVSAARQLGATFDEPYYLYQGLAFWHHTGGNDVLLHHGALPLAQDFNALFLRIEEYRRGKLWNLPQDLPRMLPVARHGTLVFWWVLLIYAWRAGKLIGGDAGGLFAAALLACEPIMLGHASLATTDIALTACVLATVYHFIVGRNSNWKVRVGIPSIWYGLSILSKSSGLPFCAICMLATEIERLWTAQQPPVLSQSQWRRASTKWWRDQLRPFWRDLWQAIGLALLIAIVYCGSGWHPEWSFVVWAKNLPQHSLSGRLMLWFAENLQVFDNALVALAYQAKHNTRHQASYLLGSVADSFWYYYPVALTIKLSIFPFLILVTLLVSSAGALRNWALASALALFLFSLAMHLQLGIRLVLPLVAFLIVGVSAALANAVRSSGRGLKKSLLEAEILLAIAWTATAALRVWPQGICYTNLLWGGTPRGYLYLSDSNYDWGQGLPELEAWRQTHGLAPIAVWYFGKDSRSHDPDLDIMSLQKFSLDDLFLLVARRKFRYLAVSTTMLYGPYSRSSANTVAALRRQKCIARTTTFLIYDLSPAHANPRSTIVSSVDMSPQGLKRVSAGRDRPRSRFPLCAGGIMRSGFPVAPKASPRPAIRSPTQQSRYLNRPVDDANVVIPWTLPPHLHANYQPPAAQDQEVRPVFRLDFEKPRQDEVSRSEQRDKPPDGATDAGVVVG